MDYRKFDKTIVLRLDKGDEINSAILGVAQKENIKLASVTGIGASDNVTVGVFNPEKEIYNRYTLTGDFEITSIVGNINTMNDKEYCHLHINIAGDSGIISGGHLISATVSLTAEIFINIIEGHVDREKNEELGINTLKFCDK